MTRRLALDQHAAGVLPGFGEQMLRGLKAYPLRCGASGPAGTPHPGLRSGTDCRLQAARSCRRGSRPRQAAPSRAWPGLRCHTTLSARSTGYRSGSGRAFRARAHPAPDRPRHLALRIVPKSLFCPIRKPSTGLPVLRALDVLATASRAAFEMSSTGRMMTWLPTPTRARPCEASPARSAATSGRAAGSAGSSGIPAAAKTPPTRRNLSGGLPRLHRQRLR